MQFSDSALEHALDPLKVVDIKTLNAVAESFKKSKDKSKRAIGVFLDRINRLRSAEPDTPTGGTGSTSRAATATTNSDVLKSSGLKDLRD